MSEREDRDEWSREHRAQVRTIFGLIVGGLLIVAGVVLEVGAFLIRGLDWVAVVAGGGLILFGLVAALPGTFMPVLSAVLRRLPWGKATNIVKSGPGEYEARANGPDSGGDS